jgi:hypothetical protein
MASVTFVLKTDKVKNITERGKVVANISMSPNLNFLKAIGFLVNEIKSVSKKATPNLIATA